MPDTTMCNNLKCKLKDFCHRFTATPLEHRQSYATFEFVLLANRVYSCENFIPNKNNKTN